MRRRTGLAFAWLLAMTGPAEAAEFAAARQRMLGEIDSTYASTRAETGLAAMSPRVRAAMGKVERHRLVAPNLAEYAYRNHPLAIGQGQTISQPYIVALSTDLIDPQPQHVVLEIGTGSGYQAAVLAEVVKQVHSIELLPELGNAARERLLAMGYRSVEVRIGDGYAGWPEKAPFDSIVVTAAAPTIPPALVAQLKPGGRMVIPVGASGAIQQLILVTKRADGSIEEKNVLSVRFVPLVPGKAAK